MGSADAPKVEVIVISGIERKYFKI